MITLANEFITRYAQLRSDYKPHFNAIDVLENEFDFQIDHDCTVGQTYFFIDFSVADWNDKRWRWDYYETSQT